MVFSLAYWSMCRLLELLVLRRRTEREKEIEILLLRHQLRVLERQVARPQLTQADRALMAAFSRVLPGRACKFIVSGNWAEFRTPQGIGLLREQSNCRESASARRW
jgi:hypothetical protein